VLIKVVVLHALDLEPHLRRHLECNFYLISSHLILSYLIQKLMVLRPAMRSHLGKHIGASRRISLAQKQLRLVHRLLFIRGRSSLLSPQRLCHYLIAPENLKMANRQAPAHHVMCFNDLDRSPQRVRSGPLLLRTCFMCQPQRQLSPNNEPPKLCVPNRHIRTLFHLNHYHPCLIDFV
jgi:hypothetical protein